MKSQIKRLLCLSVCFVLLTGQVHGQYYQDESYGDAYFNSSYATYLAIGIPVVAIIALAVVVGTSRQSCDAHVYVPSVSTSSTRSVSRQSIYYSH